MKERANRMVLPEVTVVDMRKELEIGNRSIFSTLLSAEIGKKYRLRPADHSFPQQKGVMLPSCCAGTAASNSGAGTAALR